MRDLRVTFLVARLNLIPFLIPFCFWFRLSDPCPLDFVLQKSYLEFKIAEGGDECWGGVGDVDACIAEFAAHGIRASQRVEMFGDILRRSGRQIT